MIPSDVALALNGLVTLTLAGSTFYLYRKTAPRTLAFAFWAIGYSFYGLEIMLRYIFSLTMDDLAITVFFAASLPFLIGGTSLLVNRLRVFLFLFGPLVAIAFLLLGMGYNTPSFVIGLFGSFGAMVLGAYFISRRLGRVAAAFLIGWVVLFISNLLIPMNCPEVVVDGMAALSKVIIIFGTFDQKFTTLLLGLADSEAAIASPSSAKGHLRLILVEDFRQSRQIDWLNTHLRTLTRERRLTHLVASSGIPIESDVENLAAIYGMTIVKVVRHPSHVAGGAFPFRVELGDNPSNLKEFVELLVRMSSRSRMPTEVILVGLSWLRGGDGGEEKVASFLLKELQDLHRGDVVLTAVLYPDDYSEKTLTLLRNIEAETVKI